jgi:hypothetical protein
VNKWRKSTLAAWRIQGPVESSDSLTLAGSQIRFQAGYISEIVGTDDTRGRASLTNTLLAKATQQGEACAVVDCCGSFHPESAAKGGVDLTRVLWVRCGQRLDHAMTAADWILHAGGFRIVALDLYGAPAHDLQRIPLSWWHRFRLVVEHTPAILLVAAEKPVTGSCASTSLLLEPARTLWSGTSHTPLLEGLELRCISRKPIQRESSILKVLR